MHAYHSTDCVGYGFKTIKKKIKEEFSKYDKETLVALKRDGTEITENVYIPEVVFYCDSTIDNLLMHSDWIPYPVVMVECTGYPERQVSFCICIT